MYDFRESESKWSELWKKEEIYRFDPKSEKPVYSIDNPPRYASANIHIGHAVHYTHIDFFARYHRMKGYNVLFPMCFDVNGMPIEVNVEKKYDIKMRETDRHEFIKLCEDFANSNISNMVDQYRKLGESMDLSVYYQTDAPYYRRITQLSFIKMFEKGLVYKAKHPVNWCPRCGTAIADAEIVYEERETKLNYIHFKIKDGGALDIATTRPELLCTCQLIAVHPEDERYRNIVGKTAIVPIYNREVKVVADDKVDPACGTGAVMICSVGDKDDLEWIYHYHLDFQEGIDEAGRMTERAGKYAGLEIKEAREKIIDDLKAEGSLYKQEKIDQSVGTCWRCHTPIEFINREQWFIKTVEFKDDIKKWADEINWYPEFMKVRLDAWIESLEWDWVVSRQRYFATPIPVWECENGHAVPYPFDKLKKMNRHIDPVVDDAPYDKCPVCGAPLKGAEDVFDTWVDSSITALYNTFWERDGQLFNKIYPMSMRPQAHDIIRTWAFYSILRCASITGEIPWKDIFVDGFILGPDGRPMHASWGNVVDPMKIVNEYGADAFRYFAALCTPGEDTAFKYKDVVRGQRLVTKLYNIGQFLKGRTAPGEIHAGTDPVDDWVLHEYTIAVEKATDAMNSYRYDIAIRSAEQFMWHVFADHYIEIAKKDLTENRKRVLYSVGLGIIKMFAPFLPHITEEVYQSVYREFEKKKSIHIADWPPEAQATTLHEEGRIIKDIIASVRAWKGENGLSLNTPLKNITLVSDSVLNENIIAKALNSENVEVRKEGHVEKVVQELKPNFALLGPMMKDRMKEFLKEIRSMDPSELWSDVLNGKYQYGNITITPDMLTPVYKTVYGGHEVDTVDVGDILVLIEK